MAVTRAELALLAGAAIVAGATPMLLLRPSVSRVPAPPAPLVVPPDAPPLSAVFARPVFGGAAIVDDDASAPDDAPALVGIVGRIGRDAVALVRAGDGRTRTLAIGESIEGWTLESLTIDAALFARGGQRARVALPAGE